MSTSPHAHVAASERPVSVGHVDIQEAMQRARALRARWLATQLRRLVTWMRARLHAPAGRPVTHAG
jgi:erythromycin esterase-like protein